MLTYSLKVAEIKKDTKDTVTVCFKQPGLKRIKYKAGQYLTLVFHINGRRYIRPYSFSSAPGIDSYLEVTVKRVPGGIVSNHINDQLEAGMAVEVMEPMGDFFIDENNFESSKKIMLWAAGSGITPLISIAKFILYTKDHGKVFLIYGNTNFETVIFLDKIKELQSLFPTRFFVWHFHTRLVVEHANPHVVQGRISPQKVLSIVKNTDGLVNVDHFICGPTGLKESVKNALREFGVSDNNVFTEDFELVKDPKDFEDVFTRNIKMNFGGQDYEIEVTKGKSILEAGLDALLDLPYSCQTGSCSLCKGRLIKGKVKAIGLAKHPDNLKEDERLLCCTYPLTDDVVIEAYA